MRNILFAAIFALSAAVANAGLLDTPTVVDSTASIGGVPAGFVVNDLLLDFDGQIFGQQLVVELESGSLFQQETFGGETAPNGALIGAFPDVEADTFVTLGGATAGDSSDVLVVGGTTELGKNGPKQIDTAGINIAWAPAPGIVVADQTGYQVARITASDDANGLVFFYSNTGGTGTVVEGGKIVDGALSFIPEPTSAVLVGLALAGFAARRNG